MSEKQTANGSGGQKLQGQDNVAYVPCVEQGQDNVAYVPCVEQGQDNVAYVPCVDDVAVNVQPGHKSSDGGPSSPQLEAAETGDRYGCGSCKPRWLQRLGNIKVFVFLVVLLCLVEGFAVNGIANAALIHLEKQFGLTSTRSALISSSQDIGAMIVVLFVSFVGSRFCKPHCVAVGSLFMALGSLLFIVPHLINSASQDAKGPPPSNLCDLTPNKSSSGPGDSGGSVSSYLGVFMVANMLHGIGFTPVFTLGTVYIDENEEHTMAAVYVGMTYAAAAVGVAMGFFIGGQITENYYVDFDTLDQSKLSFGPRDPQWVGAWWLGFIPSCILFILLIAPIYGFPKSLPSGEKKVEVPTTSEDPDTKDGDQKSLCSLIKETIVLFFKAVKRLIVNPLFILLSLGAAAETLIISGVSSFAFKYLAEQFSMSFDRAGNLLGGLILVGGTGMLSGGVIIRLLRLEAVGMTRMLVVLTVVASAVGCAILAGCSEVRLAGQEVPYPGDTSVNNYSASCQGACQCADVNFDPVCGSDKRVYFSPCHAGCLGMSEPGPAATYYNCSCVAAAHKVQPLDPSAIASKGRCLESCDNENIFLPCLFIMFFAVLLTTTPNSMAILRVVDQDIRPFALGFQWMLIRLLGTIPGPPVVGYVLDQTCLVWSSTPDGTQFCSLYNKGEMSKGIFIWWIVVNLLGAVFYAIASCIISRKKTASVDL